MIEEWPSYFTGRRDHIHALGVISLSYSPFERDLFTLYAHHPSVKGMPRELVEKYWSSQNEASQVKSVRACDWRRNLIQLRTLVPATLASATGHKRASRAYSVAHKSV